MYTLYHIYSNLRRVLLLKHSYSQAPQNFWNYAYPAVHVIQRKAKKIVTLKNHYHKTIAFTVSLLYCATTDKI